MKLKSILKHFYKSSIILLCLSVMISGCATATKPSDIPAQSFVSGTYTSYDCVELRTRKSEWESRYRSAFNDQERRYKSDKAFFGAAVGVGVTLGLLSGGIGGLWGLLGLGVQGDSDVTYNEIAQSQADLQAINLALQNKNC